MNSVEALLGKVFGDPKMKRAGTGLETKERRSYVSETNLEEDERIGVSGEGPHKTQRKRKGLSGKLL